MHLLSSSGSSKGPASIRSTHTQDTNGTVGADGKSKKTGAKSLAPSVPEHKIKFEEFHNQVCNHVAAGVYFALIAPLAARRPHFYRLSRSRRERSHDGERRWPRIGRACIDLRITQMKSGHRACYMSRAFAQQHAFIPKDAAPGFYGFSGITNLGTWPIKVSGSMPSWAPCSR